MAEDMLLATSDPTTCEIRLPGIDKAILSDTVGFVSDLPDRTVAAFRATLEEDDGRSDRPCPRHRPSRQRRAI